MKEGVTQKIGGSRLQIVKDSKNMLREELEELVLFVE